MRLRIDAHDLSANEGHAWDGCAHGVGDVVLGQCARGYLVEQRAEELIRVAIDQDDVDPRGLPQQFGRIKASESCPDDDDLHALHKRMVPVMRGCCQAGDAVQPVGQAWATGTDDGAPLVSSA